MSRAAKLYRATAVPMTRGVNTARGQSRGSQDLPHRRGPAEAWRKLGDVQPGFSTTALAPITMPRPGSDGMVGVAHPNCSAPQGLGWSGVK